MGRHGTIAGRKSAQDSKRAALFTKYARLVTVAAKAGGDPDYNPGLRTAIDKAKAIERVIEILGIEHKNVIACGDGFNDTSMVKYAAVGVAMANAQAAVKRVADFITSSNDEDGIVKVIDRFILCA